MKKLLALVLALVMVLSLCVVTSNAAYSDAADIDYKEAVDVMSAIGVLEGADGKFNPDGILTREQAAKIVTYMLLGKKAADALVTIAAPFADVEATRWSAGSIAYCYNEGILAGVGNGMFAPTSQLTGLAFAKMMLTALGYNAANEGLTGTNWSINTAKLALTVGLTDGMDDVALSAPMTREQAAKMALNTLQAPMVEYKNASTITIGDVQVSTSSKASEITTGNKGGLTLGDGTVLEFAEKYFTKLNNVGATDKFGRPAVKWTYDGNKVGTYTEKADKTIVMAKEKNFKTILTDSEYLDYDEDDILAGADLYINGDKVADTYVAFDEEEHSEIGATVEVYENDNDKVETVVMIVYTVAKIDDVNTNLSTALQKKGATTCIQLVDADSNIDVSTFANTTVYDAYDNRDEYVLGGFDAKTYVEGAVIAIAVKNSDDRILDSYVVKTVTGDATTYKKADYLCIDGTKYTFDSATKAIYNNVGDITIGDAYKVFLSKEGYILGTDAVNTDILEDTFFVVGAYKTVSARGSVAYYAQVVKLDGTTEDLKLKDSTEFDDIAKDGGNNYDILNGAADQSSVEADTMYAAQTPLFVFTETDGKYTVAAYGAADKFDAVVSQLDGSMNKKSSSVVFDSATSIGGVTTLTKKYLTDNTKFIAIEKAGDDLKVKTATGVMSMADNTKAIVIFEDDAKEASYVIFYDLGTALNGATNLTDVLYLNDATYVKVKEGYKATIFYIDEQVEEEVVLNNNYGTGFYTVNKTETKNGVEVTTLNVYNTYIGAPVASNTDGVNVNITFTSAWKNNDNYYLSDGTNYTDIKFNGAVVTDNRDSDDAELDTYSAEIDSVSALYAAMDSDDNATVTANVVVKDGKITMVDVLSMTDKEYTIAAAELAGNKTGMTISTVQTTGEDDDVIDIYVTIAAGTTIDGDNDVLTLTVTSGADALTAHNGTGVASVTAGAATLTQTTLTANVVVHFTAQVNAANVTGLTVTAA